MRVKQTPFQKHVKKIYANMVNRLSEKTDKNGRIIRHGVTIPFTVEQLEKWLDDKFSENATDSRIPHDWVKCKYCEIAIFWQTCSIDHEIPLKRGGGAGLDNLETICKECNQYKGGLTPGEYITLRNFVALFDSEAKIDIESRLKKAVKLAASVNWFRKKKKTK